MEVNDVVLYSGGIDSFLVHHYLCKQGIDHKLLYFDLGGKYSVNEVELFENYIFKRNIKQDVIVSECLQMGELEHEDAFIPNRNILAAIMAHSVTNYDRIWVGGTLSDRVNDNNQKVFETISSLLSDMYQKTITVDSPFWQNHKPDLVKEFVEDNGWKQYDSKLEARKALVYSTFSCYYPVSEKHSVDIYFDDADTLYCTLTSECMNCPACFRKCMSLYDGGIFIPMSKNAKTIAEKYYNESKEYIKQSDDVFGDTSMLGRMEATVKYCDHLFEYWSKHV